MGSTLGNCKGGNVSDSVIANDEGISSIAWEQFVWQVMLLPQPALSM